MPRSRAGAEAWVTGGKEERDPAQPELVPLMIGLWSGLCPVPSFSKDELTPPYSPLCPRAVKSQHGGCWVRQCKGGEE